MENQKYTTGYLDKILIITTGTSDWIQGRLLPSLYTNGNYNGEVLIINYGEFSFEEEQTIYSGYGKKVKFSRATKRYLTYTTDRFRAFENALRYFYHNYEIIMHVDGNDIEFRADFESLLEQIKDSLIVTQELPCNNFVTYWKTYHTLPTEFREAIANKRIINAGMFLGPAKLMYQVIKEIANLEEYDTRFGMDQLMLNVLCYYYGVPFDVVGREWNTFPREVCEIGEQNIKIMHYAGIHPNKPNETDFVKPKNWLFPTLPDSTEKIEEEQREKESKRVKNWLFG